jgi:anthranilate phosphoribosyltransferase
MTRMAAATTMWQLGRPTDAEPDRSAAVCGSRGPSRQSITVLLVTLVLASAAGLEPLHGQSEEPGLREDVEAQF